MKKESSLLSDGVPSLAGDIKHKMIKEYKAAQDENNERDLGEWVHESY